jgi:hypothetical protein
MAGLVMLSEVGLARVLFEWRLPVLLVTLPHFPFPPVVI